MSTYKVEVVSLKMVKKEPIMIEEGPIINKYKAISVISNQIGDRDQEIFVILCLDAKGKINSYSEVHIGTLNSALVHPREVFKTAILSNAHAIIIGHNHPSGDLNPSSKDLEVTKNLVDVGHMLSLEVQDHIIVSGREGESIRENHSKLFENKG